jgi:hypothetical protein
MLNWPSRSPDLSPSVYDVRSHIKNMVYGNKLYTKEMKLQGRVSKKVTNGSKTAVMDILGFLRVSIGSSTVQLHDSLGCRHVCACSVVKMATVLEMYTTKE